MKFSRFILVPAILLLHGQAIAQKFFSKEASRPLSFMEMQRQFDEWKSRVDLKSEKNWKYFKRWEMDMQLHTDARGNPGDPAIYIDAVTKAAREKQLQATSRFLSAGWTPSGPDVVPNNMTGYMENGIGRINCIAFHPNDPATYFIGVAQGGVWKTTNNGQSWTPITESLPILRISDIAIDPNNTDVMYLSVCDFEYLGFGLNLNGRKRNTHYGLGVYKTTDGGVSWQPSGLSFQLTNGDASLIRKVLVQPSNSSHLVACGTSGMYTSTDAGATWTQRMDSLFWDLVQDPVNPDILYAATGWVYNANDGSAGIYKSVDFGNTWTLLNTNIPPTGVVQRIKLAIAPSDPNRIYAITVNLDFGMDGIYKSSDAGQSWQFINPGLNVLEGGDGTGSGGQGNYDLALMVDATDKDRVYAGGVNIWGSSDGAQTFNPVSHWTLSYGPTLHGDIHFMQQQPLTGNIFVCNDGGLYRTAQLFIHNWTDANNGVPWPTQWTNLSSGMQVTSFYRLSSSRNTVGRLMAGAQDNASFHFDGNAWSTIFGGDGMDNYLDPQNDNVIIGSSQYGYFNQSFDGGFSANGINANVNNEVAEWTTPLVADYTNPGTFYIGYSNVSKSTDNGQNWSVISAFPVPGFADHEISAMAVADSDPDFLYVCKRVRYEYGIPGAVYMTNDGGQNWNTITAGLPDSLYYTSVDIHYGNAAIAYISMAGFSAGNKVFKTPDGGQTWQNISFNLPNLPVNCIRNVPGTDILLAGTDIGVYVLDSASSSWGLYSTGLPNVIVTDIEINVALNKIYVSTFGRGIWETGLGMLLYSGEGKDVQIPEVELYPTVNTGDFTIRFVSKQESDKASQLEVIDITGRRVAAVVLSGHDSYQQHLDLKPGKYFARISNRKTSVVKGFVVE
ncbi:MAG TPA: T9SS type A sorting domain-containing protein [Bacteroidia bacterium]|nr:T9SS type A sorting domain-containing protein [Bacteroidia bacterium]